MADEEDPTEQSSAVAATASARTTPVKRMTVSTTPSAPSLSAPSSPPPSPSPSPGFEEIETIEIPPLTSDDGDQTPLIRRIARAPTTKRKPSVPLVTRHARHRSTASGNSASAPVSSSSTSVSSEPTSSSASAAARLPDVETDYILVDDPDAPAKPPVTAAQFLAVVDSVRDAIDHGVFPLRASKGSSGAYFARDRAGKIVGVFKPRDEEPYGKGNPKLIKWLHRTFFWFCFGRSCLIPNVGYLSEAGASYIDRRLGLNLVPRTEVVSLAAPTFHYSKAERWAAKKGWAPLPAKIGSFQIFLAGHEDASVFFSTGYERAAYLHHGQGHPLGWDSKTRHEFRLQFEKVCILDVLIRNTDRSLDNLLIKDDTNPDDDDDDDDLHSDASPSSTPRHAIPSKKQTVAKETSEHSLHPLSSSQHTESDALLLNPTNNDERPSTESTTEVGSNPSNLPDSFQRIHLGAIDNGLAFPWKHPDRWRSYPPAWLFLPLSHAPFSKEVAELILPQLSSNEWWSRTFAEIEVLFRLDPDFDEAMFRRQKAVMRGQAFSIVEVLRRAKSLGGEEGSSYALATRQPVLVFEEEVDVEVGEGGMRRRVREIRRRFEAFAKRPCFTSC